MICLSSSSQVPWRASPAARDFDVEGENALERCLVESLVAWDSSSSRPGSSGNHDAVPLLVGT